MELQIKPFDKGIKIAISGRVDTMTSSEFDKATANIPAADAPCDVELDCTDMDYISSSGLRSFITILKRCKGMGCELTVTNLNSSIKSIFDMTGFTQLFKLS